MREKVKTCGRNRSLVKFLKWFRSALTSIPSKKHSLLI